MKMQTKHIVVAITGFVMGGTVVYLAVRPKEALAAIPPPKQLPPAGGGTTPSGGRLPGLGAPLFPDGIHVFVASDVQTPEDQAFLEAVTAAFAVQAPGIRWSAVPLRPTAGKVLDLAPLAAATAAADTGAKPGDPTRAGVVLLFNKNDLDVTTPSNEFFGNIDMVEIVEEGTEFDPVEAAFIQSKRTAIARIYGLTPAVGRADPSKFARSILDDVQNPNGMPPGRSV